MKTLSSHWLRLIKAHIPDTILLLLFIASAVLIVTTACGDLWFDEIWSLYFASNANNLRELFTRFTCDNNHLLNTLYLYTISTTHIFVLYRLLSIFSGLGCLVFLCKLARLRNRMEAVIVLVLAGLSSPLIVFFSEARGYAPALFFALAAFSVCTAYTPPLSRKTLLLFWLAIMLGLLAHATFIIFLAAMLIYSVLREGLTKSPIHRKIHNLYSFYAIPLLFCTGYYALFIRSLQIGGGPSLSVTNVLGKTFMLLLGLPDNTESRSVATALFCIILTCGTYIRYRDHDNTWLFYPLMLLVTPALLLMAAHPTFLYYRYFIVCFPFFYLLLGRLLSSMHTASFPGAKTMLIILLLLYASGQFTRIIPLLRHGRGSYLAALRHITANSTNQAVRVGSDHDHRNIMLVTFYAQFLSSGQSIRYIERQNWFQEKPDWLITHSIVTTSIPPQNISMPDLGTYQLVTNYPHAGFSGWTWFLYKAGSPPRPRSD